MNDKQPSKEETLASQLKGSYGGLGGARSLESRLRTIQETRRRNSINKSLLPRTAEQQVAIRKASEWMTSLLTASINGRSPLIRPDSDIFKFVQIAPAFGERVHGVSDRGTEWWRWADVRAVIAKDPEHPNLDETVRIAFSVNKNESNQPPGWVTNIRPNSVSKNFAEVTGFWTPERTSQDIRAAVAKLSPGEQDKRRAAWASMWDPYTLVVNQLVTIVRELVGRQYLNKFGMRLLARRPDEEAELLTPIQGPIGDGKLNGTNYFNTVIIPALEIEEKELAKEGSEIAKQRAEMEALAGEESDSAFTSND